MANLYVMDMEAGGWGRMDPTEFGTVTARATAEEDADAYLVFGNSQGESIRAFDPDSTTGPVNWWWRSREVTGADYEIPGASFQCTGLRLDWHKADSTATGGIQATLYVDGIAMPVLTILESTDRIYVFGPRAMGHKFSLSLVGVNARMVSVRYTLSPRRV